jgi:hypothetical protein
MWDVILCKNQLYIVDVLSVDHATNLNFLPVDQNSNSKATLTIINDRRGGTKSIIDMNITKRWNLGIDPGLVYYRMAWTIAIFDCLKIARHHHLWHLKIYYLFHESFMLTLGISDF